MTSLLYSQKPPRPHGSPYCSEPNCQICKELGEMQEAIRLHLPIPSKKTTVRVLIVDDFDGWRRWVRSKLSNGRFEIVGEAVDGFEAVEKAVSLKPDLILLDFGLPKLNGIEVATRLLRSVPTAKIIFLSQNDDPDVQREALNCGAREFVMKAKAESDLLPVIQGVLPTSAIET